MRLGQRGFFFGGTRRELLVHEIKNISKPNLDFPELDGPVKRTRQHELALDPCRQDLKRFVVILRFLFIHLKVYIDEVCLCKFK